MTLGLRISSIGFSGGSDAIAIGDSELIALIGPNNAGKSAALREIQAQLQGGPPGPVVTGLVPQRDGSADELVTWLENASAASPHPDPSVQDVRMGPGGQIMLAQARMLWSNSQPLGPLTSFLVFHADADSRLQLAQSVPSVDAIEGQAIEPLQRLQLDHEAEERLSASVERAFGTPVCVNRTGGAQLHLHLGRPTEEPRLTNAAYLDELRSLPQVASQGDGMRSFIGLLLALRATDYPLVLIDEPEAFLHPPQAKEMGRQLGLPSRQQRFVATHDSQVLLGLVNSAASITIIRLRREGEANVPTVLNSAQVRELWEDPFLRYSNLLDGLFHRGVLICEADGDATLYTATLDHGLRSSDQASSDLLITQCGGKHKLPAAIGALAPMGVPTAAIADIDVLREERLLRRIVEALGGSWTSNLSRDLRIVAAAVESLPGGAPLVADVRKEIEDCLGDDDTQRLAEEQTRRVREIVKSTDGWRRVRSGGVAAMPNGEARQAADKLLSSLATVGLFVVPVGALEGWAPSVGGHGSAFVSAALEARAHETNGALTDFVLRVAQSIS